MFWRASWKMASMMEKLMTASAAHRNPMGRLSRSLFSLVMLVSLSLFSPVEAKPSSLRPSRVRQPSINTHAQLSLFFLAMLLARKEEAMIVFR